MEINHLNYLHFKNFISKEDFDKITQYIERHDFEWYWREKATSFLCLAGKARKVSL